ncbi:SMC family ATPase [Lysinibacillus sp. KU-BSD001]|uniref:AAA family ATPase n=1 Tax=Lysinibacillus sp. KU-BSD001 TaxID=3141328 RepID=UPI0036E4256B
MKPLKLMMRAFGPYKGEEVIDFTKLENHRLFVISGKTGAGKTTIFDGIAFALYGSGSGSDRKDHKSMRSQFAEDHVHTAVELLFEVKGRTYRVFRQLSHVKKGRKTATGEEYAFFEMGPNGEALKIVERQKAKEINAKIEEIIGLTYDQFNQIIMLPQGEFRKLLTSQTENKEAILRKIFKTEHYGEIAKKLEDKKQAAETEAKMAKAMRNQYIEQIAGALPSRHSLLFERLQNQANVYQILQALEEEKLYYEQKVIVDETYYLQSFQAHNDMQEKCIESEQLNERIHVLQTKQMQLIQKENERPLFEEKKREYEAAVKASSILPLYNTYGTTEKELADAMEKLEGYEWQRQQLETALAQANHNLKMEQAREPERTKRIHDMNVLENIKPIYEEVDILVKKIPTLQRNVEQLNEEMTNVKALYEKYKGILATHAEMVEAIEKQVAEIPETLAREQQLKEITNAFAKLNKAHENIQRLQADIETVTAHYEAVSQSYEEQEQKWIHNRAYELALTLVPGEACPVCGSIEHPNLCINDTEAIDKSALQQAKGAVVAAQQQQSIISGKLEAARSQFDDLQKELMESGVDVTKETMYKGQYLATVDALQVLQRKNEELAQLKTHVKRTTQGMEQCENELAQLRTKHEEAQRTLLQQQTILMEKQRTIPSELQTLTQVNIAYEKTEKELQLLQKALKEAEQHYELAYTNVVKVQEAIKHTDERKMDLTKKLADDQMRLQEAITQATFANEEAFKLALRTDIQMATLQQQYLQFTKEYHALTEFVQAEVQALQGKERVDVAAMRAQLVTLKETYEQAFNVLNKTREYATHCNYYAEKLTAVAEEIDQLERISGEIVQLYDVLRGKNEPRISFERYVQMGYLEQITEAANIRLERLSNGQFRLECSERQEAHGRQSGLSLDVYDSYTGQARDVKTLSGGEKFNASLCLALGMADVIQSFQGNVRIDTMFIDEGFGSLDEEALIRAIDTLIELQKSGRMVGVISHVAELKDAMPAVLEVMKQKEGYSYTTITLK